MVAKPAMLLQLKEIEAIGHVVSQDGLSMSFGQ
jgi:hypothetical protein